MPEDDRQQLRLVRDASTKDAAVITRILADGGIPTALGGVMAAAHYGSGLCPLDIELIVNDADQPRAYDILTAQEARPCVPETEEQAPASFQQWRERAPSYQFPDRRRVRLCVPMYELPRTGDPIDDALLPFVILYSAETVGLPLLPLAGEEPSPPGYTRVSSPASTLGDESACVLPTFLYLVASEMHVLLRHAEYHSLAWGQHAAQLSELLRSRSCEGGFDALPGLVSQAHSEFAEWMKCHMQGSVDEEIVVRIKAADLGASMLREWAPATDNGQEG
ncbi:hypothetical protein C8A05DRAFT_39183 [Staphylotrichum tortipilum]|uniref:Uncharacterized protein n=1 Tax=Staphylotrichum tortipilum TaxID=2831512 RepID=A0AAN6MAD9_9PEZI|nr:hypothetical protein C8A05DRAFT_39183 [Staphylotrichum longicolle]